MKSNKLSAILCFDKRQEVEKGVFENRIVEKKVRAQEIQIFQKRLNEAMKEGLVVSKRIRINEIHLESDLKYVKIKNQQFKVNTIYNSITNHFAEIELGEQI